MKWLKVLSFAVLMVASAAVTAFEEPVLWYYTACTLSDGTVIEAVATNSSELDSLVIACNLFGGDIEITAVLFEL